MGTELMEETKRRQTLEAEVQELRMRLSGVEAVALAAPRRDRVRRDRRRRPDFASYGGGGAPTDAFMYLPHTPPRAVLADAPGGGLAPCPAGGGGGGGDGAGRRGWRGGGRGELAARRGRRCQDARSRARRRALAAATSSVLATPARRRPPSLPACRAARRRRCASGRELDARVAQILGKHGQALAMLGAGGAAATPRQQRRDALRTGVGWLAADLGGG